MRSSIFICASVFTLSLLILSVSRGRDVDWQRLSSSAGDLPDPGTSDQQTAALVADLNGDGRTDFVIGSRRREPALVGFFRDDEGWNRQVLEPDLLPIEAGGTVFDIDHDGDLDLVFGEDASGSAVWWWENPLPDSIANSGWRRRAVKNSGQNKHHDQVSGDFNSDGFPELAFWNQHGRSLYLASLPENPRQETEWPRTAIYQWDRGEEHEGLTSCDIDGNGSVDLVGGGRWFRHRGNREFTSVVIDDKQRFSRVACGQLIDGGYPEVVFVAGDATGPLVLYESQGDPSLRASWTRRQLLSRDVVHGHSLDIADIDQDGNLDIFCAEMHTPGGGDQATAWILFGDGQGNFSPTIISTGVGNHESKLADLNGDGKLDILSKPYTWQAPGISIWLQKIARK